MLGARRYKSHGHVILMFFMLNSIESEISWINDWLWWLKSEISMDFDYLSIYEQFCFMLYWIEHEKMFYYLGPELVLIPMTSDLYLYIGHYIDLLHDNTWIHISQAFNYFVPSPNFIILINKQHHQQTCFLHKKQRGRSAVLLCRLISTFILCCRNSKLSLLFL